MDGGVGFFAVIAILLLAICYCLFAALVLKYGAQLVHPSNSAGRLPKDFWTLAVGVFGATYVAIKGGYVVAGFWPVSFGKARVVISTGVIHFISMSALSFLLLYPKNYRASNKLGMIAKPVLLGIAAPCLAATVDYGLFNLLFMLAS